MYKFDDLFYDRSNVENFAENLITSTISNCESIFELSSRCYQKRPKRIGNRAATMLLYTLASVRLHLQNEMFVRCSYRIGALLKMIRQRYKYFFFFLQVIYVRICSLISSRGCSSCRDRVHPPFSFHHTLWRLHAIQPLLRNGETT